MVINYYAFIPFTAFLLNLFLFAYILAIPKKSRVHISYMIFVLPCALWQFLDYFSWSLAPGDLVMEITRFAVLAWMPSPVLFLNFVNRFIDRKPDFLFWGFLGFVVIFSVIGVSSDLIVTGVRYEPWGVAPEHGRLLYPALTVCILGPMVYGLILIFRVWNKESDAVFRKQLMIIFMGNAIALVGSLIPNVLVPRILNIGSPPQIGSALLAIQSAFFFVAVVRYRIFAIGIKQSAYDVFSQVNDCVVILDRNKKVVEINKSAVELLGLHNVDKRDIDFQALFQGHYSFEKEYNLKEITCDINQVRKTIVFSQSALREAGTLTGKLVILRDITAWKDAEEEIRTLNQKLEGIVAERTVKLQNARDEIVRKEYKSELADITSETLHNVKNILNSVKVSSEMIEKAVEGYLRHGLGKANSLLRENFHNLEAFINSDPKGRRLMEYYLRLEEIYDRECGRIKGHIYRLREKINAIEEIVTSQQAYGGSDIQEAASLREIIDDALIMQSVPIMNSNIRVIKEIEETPVIVIKKTKVMHILVNLIKNAKEAMMDTPTDDRVLTFKTYSDREYVFLTLTDTGCGILPENINNMFKYGFTTKKDGHGFGLHSSCNYMAEMGGRLMVESGGENQGATFMLQFPLSDYSHP